ncbi:hypothetical protein [Microbacterium sp. HJ5]
MPVSRTKTLWKSLAGAVVAVSLVVAPLVSTGAAAADLIGTPGTPEVATSEANKESYWEARYAAHKADCYKLDGPWSSSHGSVSADGKTVTLKPFDQSWPGDHWEVLVIKAGNTNFVTEHPQAGVAYASPTNNGGQQATVSHWIVCKGTTPQTPPTVVTPTLAWTLPSCDAAGVLTKSPNVEWLSKLNADGTTTWTAKPLAGTVFADGAKTEWTVPNLDRLTTEIEACRPPQPDAEVVTEETSDYDCASVTVTVLTVTTTTPYVWNGTAWVKGEPVEQKASSLRPMTADEKKDCPLPDTNVEYGSWVDGEWDCGDTQVTQTREITTTVFEYDAEGNATAKSTVALETKSRDLTQAEIGTCPLLPGEIFSSCVGDVPYLSYGVTLPEGYEPDSETPVTVTFVNPEGDDYVVPNQALSGKLLWPGASATEPKMWPGWEIVNGTYVKTEGNFDWSREGITVRFAVNPDYETVLEYPEATALCANPPEQAISPESPTDPETPATGGPESGPLAATGGGVSPIVPIAGGALLVMGLAAVALVAYQRRREAHASR